MFNTNSKRVISTLLALTVLLSSAGAIAMAAQPTIDTETTNTASTSDVTDGHTFVYNETNGTTAYLQYTADSNNSTVEIKQGSKQVYFNDSAETVNATHNTHRVAINATEDFTDVEAGGGENVSLTATITNNTEATSPDTKDITVHYKHEDDSARLFVDDADADGDVVEFGDLSIRQKMPFFGDDIKPATVDETFAVAGQNTTTASFSISNESTQDAFSESIDGEDAGVWTPSAYAKINDHWVPVFAEEAPDVEWLDNDEDAYIVLSSSGDKATIHNLDAVVASDDTTVDVELTGNQKMGFMNAKSMFAEDLDEGVTTWAIQSLKAL